MPISTESRPFHRRLYLPTYRVTDAARYAGTSAQNVANWLYRETTTGVTLPGKERRRPLSYLQLIEVAVVAIFKKLGAPLENIRKARDYLAQNFNTEYPFTIYQFKTDGYHLLLEFAEFEPELSHSIDLVVADKAGQIAWQYLVEDRLLEFDYDEELDLAIRWHVAGRASPVIIDPRIAFGAPTVRGIPTWVLRGRANAGETLYEMKEDFRLEEDEIREALQFEQVSIAS